MTDNTPLFNIPSGSIQIGDRMHEETGVIGRSTSGSPVESSPHFHLLFPRMLLESINGDEGEPAIWDQLTRP